MNMYCHNLRTVRPIKLDQNRASKNAFKLRKGIIADVKDDDFSNGEGVRVTVFVSGCL